MPILSVEYLYFAHPMAAKHLGVGFGRWSGPTLAIMNSRLPFRANLENWYRWLTCASVRGLVCRVGMNVTLAHIFLPFYLNRWKSTTHGFHSKPIWRTHVVDSTVAQYVDWLVFLFVWMSPLLTVPCHSICTTGDNQLTGSMPSKLGELALLTELWLSTWIGVSFSYECLACSHFLAMLYHQSKTIRLVTSIQSFVMDHFWSRWIFVLIALLKLI